MIVGKAEMPQVGLVGLVGLGKWSFSAGRCGAARFHCRTAKDGTGPSRKRLMPASPGRDASRRLETQRLRELAA